MLIRGLVDEREAAGSGRETGLVEGSYRCMQTFRYQQRTVLHSKRGSGSLADLAIKGESVLRALIPKRVQLRQKAVDKVSL